MIINWLGCCCFQLPPSQMSENFGKSLRRLRGERSQREVAAALGIPTTTLSSLEQQDTVPRGPMLEMLCGHFGVAVDYFFPVPEKEISPAVEWLRLQRQRKFNVAPTVATNSAPDAEITPQEKATFDKLIGAKRASS